MSQNKLSEFFYRVYVTSTAKQLRQEDFHAWSIQSIQVFQKNKWEGSEVPPKTPQGLRAESSSHRNYFTVLGENALCFSVPLSARMLHMPLVSSGLCLHSSSSEVNLASVLRSGRSVVLTITMSFTGRPCIFLSCCDGHLTIWNVWNVCMWWEALQLREPSWLSDFTGQSAPADSTCQGLQNHTL